MLENEPTKLTLADLFQEVGEAIGAFGETLRLVVRGVAVDDQGHYAWMNFVRAGNADLRSDRPKSFYPIWVMGDGKIYVPKLLWSEEHNAYDVLEERPNDIEEVYPIKLENGQKIEKRWQRGHERVRKEYEEYRAHAAEHPVRNWCRLHGDSAARAPDLPVSLSSCSGPLLGFRHQPAGLARNRHLIPSRFPEEGITSSP